MLCRYFKPSFVFILSASLFLFLSCPCSGDDNPYYDVSPKKGWWWYEPVKEPDRKEDSKPQAAVPLEASKTPRDYSPEELWRMHPDEFQKLYTATLKKAMQDPDNAGYIHDYYVMTDTMRRKSLAFANASMAFVQTHPAYDMNSAVPLAAPGRLADYRARENEIKDTILAARDSHALVYFSQEGCSFCSEQDKILKFFIDKYGWEIKEYDIRAAARYAAFFGIETTPSLLLISKNSSDYINVSVGVVALSEIETKLYAGIRILSGKASPTDYSTYYYQQGGALDVKAPQKKNNNNK